jgi:hypothetical protein
MHTCALSGASAEPRAANENVVVALPPPFLGLFALDDSAASGTGEDERRLAGLCAREEEEAKHKS